MRETSKSYLAICEGVPSRPQAAIEAPIGRDPRDRTRMGIVKQGRDARTTYELLHSDHDVSLLLVKPETGRTHQIRVHLAAVGIPVRFDTVYGKAGKGRQQLHAWRIEAPHPAGGRLQVTAPLPPDMARQVRGIAAEQLALEYSTAVPATLSEATA
jgi:23S rRNA pseudouridine1911/1915/1917 synthase